MINPLNSDPPLKMLARFCPTIQRVLTPCLFLSPLLCTVRVSYREIRKGVKEGNKVLGSARAVIAKLLAENGGLEQPSGWVLSVGSWEYIHGAH